MNKRQKKKRNKYNTLRYSIYFMSDVMPNDWSEIRWFKQWYKEHYKNIIKKVVDKDEKECLYKTESED